MFFIVGISSGSRQLPDSKTDICSQCGAFGRYQVFMTYMYFSFFFIPLIKWNKKFQIRMSCCGSIFELETQKGKRLAKGEQIEITERDLTLIQAGRGNTYRCKKTCSYCTYETEEDFEFCPKCGQKL